MLTDSKSSSRYHSDLIFTIKCGRDAGAVSTEAVAPLVLDLSRMQIKLAGSFGLCFGVANAIHTAEKALRENPDRRIFLLSEMIHNPLVNQDLSRDGVRFIFAPSGEQLVPFSELTPDDILLIPAFGAPLEILDNLKMTAQPRIYDATCPFVQRVWKTAKKFQERGFTAVIHGKPSHAETRATFSRCCRAGAALIISGIAAAQVLSAYISGLISAEHLLAQFTGMTSHGFNAARDLTRLGVVNQTTMSAAETAEISRLLREALITRYGEAQIDEHWYDTGDTLCYATDRNQSSLIRLLDAGGDLALVVGGYNSSNTAHLAALANSRVPTYHIQDAGEILDLNHIRHFDYSSGKITESQAWFPTSLTCPVVLISAGASCPDTIVEGVLLRLAELTGCTEELEPVINKLVEGRQVPPDATLATSPILGLNG